MIYFDKETDKKLLEATSEEEVKAIIASLPATENLEGKTDLIMAEINRIKNNVDEELDQSELDMVAGGAKRIRVDLSETQKCIATFYLEDLKKGTFLSYCSSNDFCKFSNEYEYHFQRYSNCKRAGSHSWIPCPNIKYSDGYSSEYHDGYLCVFCDLKCIPELEYFDD